MSNCSAKRALITGAASGLGKALALRFARAGWRVAVCDLDEPGVRRTANEIDQAGGAGLAVRADVTNSTDVDKFAELVNREWQGLDVLVNNAGIAAVGRVDETEMDDWRRVFEIDFFSVVSATRTMLPLISRGGHIVNIASFAGLAAAPGLAAYNTAKAAVIAFSESLRAELVANDIGVSVACPSFFKTRLMETSGAPQDATREMVEKMMERSSITADDVANQIFDSVSTRKFMLIAHSNARWHWRLKRFFPEYYFSRLRKFARRVGLQHQSSENIAE